MSQIKKLLKQIRACQVCVGELPLGPRPVLQMSAESKILIVGQAPGIKVHETGIPWNDPSGERLREWLGLDRELFYDPELVAIVPVGFCYPGRGKSGDNPPRKECYELWHGKIQKQLPDIRLTLLVGGYAQQRYLGNKMQETATETIRHWRDYAPDYVPLPHPSPRNNIWLKKNPWFEKEVVPEVRSYVQNIIREI